MQGVSILGSTGSIGVNTLDVISRHPERYAVTALSAHSNAKLLIQQINQFEPKTVCVTDPEAYGHVKDWLTEQSLNTELVTGREGLQQVAGQDEADIVMAAIVGAAGLQPTLTAVKAGKRVLLANKEALVMSGRLFVDAVHQYKAELLPIDSEHNAIFQCLPPSCQHDGVDMEPRTQGIERILLTGSGGPFLKRDLSSLDQVTPDEACKHPNWSMGRKISVDSATMMNKGLELIEARWLFNVAVDQIDVVIHPQSVIHSMVRYADGSVLAQMGNPDMRTPIAHALAYPERLAAGVEPLDFFAVNDFTFTRPDFERYPNLALAIEACKMGQGATTSLNASNEVAVSAFLQQTIRFTDIARINEKVLSQGDFRDPDDLNAILAIDEQARQLARAEINKIGGC